MRIAVAAKPAKNPLTPSAQTWRVVPRKRGWGYGYGGYGYPHALVNIKIAGKWMHILPKYATVGFDPLLKNSGIWVASNHERSWGLLPEHFPRF